MSLQKVLISYEEYSRLKEIEKLYEELCRKQLRGKTNFYVAVHLSYPLVPLKMYLLFSDYFQTNLNRVILKRAPLLHYSISKVDTAIKNKNL